MIKPLSAWWAAQPGIVALLGGLLCGFVVLGVGGRLAMTIVALAIGARVEWDIAGTMQVVVLGTALGPPAGVAYVALERHLPGARRATKGWIFGTAYCAALTAIYFLRPAGPVELQAAPLLGSFLFGGLVVLFGPALALTVGWLSNRRTSLGRPSAFLGGVIALVVAGSLGLALFALISR